MYMYMCVYVCICGVYKYTSSLRLKEITCALCSYHTRCPIHSHAPLTHTTPLTPPLLLHTHTPNTHTYTPTLRVLVGVTSAPARAGASGRPLYPPSSSSSSSSSASSSSHSSPLATTTSASASSSISSSSSSSSSSGGGGGGGGEGGRDVQFPLPSTQPGETFLPLHLVARAGAALYYVCDEVGGAVRVCISVCACVLDELPFHISLSLSLCLSLSLSLSLCLSLSLSLSSPILKSTSDPIPHSPLHLI